MSPFFNQTWKGVYTDDKTGIGSYIDLEQKRLIKVLDDAQFVEFNIPEVLGLFTNIKVQERHLGFMFQYCTSFKEWNISLLCPFLYQENNFYLSPSEIKRIEQEPLFKDFEGDIIEFAKQHLLS